MRFIWNLRKGNQHLQDLLVLVALPPMVIAQASHLTIILDNMPTPMVARLKIHPFA
jgi:hypothetical protein